MVTKVTASTADGMFPDLVFNLINKPDTDLYEMRDIQGLGPVKANVNTTPLGSVDGESYAGSSMGIRNIVLTIGWKPDWITYSPEALRRKLDNHFMPKKMVDLYFDSLDADNYPKVWIRGYVESAEPNIFSKDMESQISIICPNPHFQSYESHYVEGYTDDAPAPITYDGTLETGLHIGIGEYGDAGPYPGKIDIFSGGNLMEITKAALLSNLYGVNMSSIPGLKYVLNSAHHVGGPADASLLQYTTLSAGVWPKLVPGTQSFYVHSDVGHFKWFMTYYDLYGSL